MSANHLHTDGTALTSGGPRHGAAFGGGLKPHAVRVRRVPHTRRVPGTANRPVGSAG